MEPTFKDGDVVLVNKLSYFFGKPRIGDPIVLRRKKYLVKRINKIAGDRLFVLGDNKKESADSREFDWIDRKEIVGKVIFNLRKSQAPT